MNNIEILKIDLSNRYIMNKKHEIFRYPKNSTDIVMAFNNKLYLRAAISYMLDKKLKDIHISWYFLGKIGFENSNLVGEFLKKSLKERQEVFVYLDKNCVVGISNDKNLDVMKDVYKISCINEHKTCISLDTEFLQIYDVKEYLQVGYIEFDKKYEINDIKDVILNPVISNKMIKNFNKVFDKFDKEEGLRNTINELLCKTYSSETVRGILPLSLKKNFSNFDLENNFDIEQNFFKKELENNIILVWGGHEEEQFMKKYDIDTIILDVQKFYGLFILDDINKQISLQAAFEENTSEEEQKKILQLTHNAVIDAYMVFMIVKNTELFNFK